MKRLKHKLQYKVDNKMRYFGETNFDKGIVRVNKTLSKTRTLSGAKKKDNYPGVADTIYHEMLHVQHPNMTERQAYKKTRVAVKKLTKKQKQKLYNKFA